MTDDDIDTSDIPPLTDEFFERARMVLPRIYLDRLDLIEARKFAAYILEKGWPSKKEVLAHTAFNTALIIAYARPFGMKKDLKGQREKPLDEQVGEVLTEEAEIALHSRVKELRHESFAHSDARSHLLEGFDYSNQIVSFKPELPLSQSETTLLATMIQKWINHLDSQIAKFKESRSRIT
ncbi:MAG TPA: hypothetical protein VMS31_23400 [Pyrinomonadaceae bacterium]|nr:hypothetical protein [Pyrinomonadaceae bacterium]